MERYQTFGKRFLAAIVDSIVFSPILIVYVWLGFTGASTEMVIAASFVGTLLGISYTILLHWVYGQTLGKMALKVKVVDVSTENNISLAQSCLREGYYIVTETVHFGIYGYLLLRGLSLTTEPAAWIEIYSPVLLVVWTVVNVIVCLKHPKNRALHDLIAGIVVVRLDVPGDETANLYFEPPSPDTYEDLGDPRQ